MLGFALGIETEILLCSEAEQKIEVYSPPSLFFLTRERPKNKNRNNLDGLLRFFVESGRVELPSKQATKKLSTRLFSVWVFDVGLGQKQPPNA